MAINFGALWAATIKILIYASRQLNPSSPRLAIAPCIIQNILRSVRQGGDPD